MKASQASAASARLINVPGLPSILRYYDDFDDVVRTIQSPTSLDRWPLEFDGRKVSLDFTFFSGDAVDLGKLWMADQLQHNSPSTAYNYNYTIRAVPTTLLHELVLATPSSIRDCWSQLFAHPDCYRGAMEAVRSLLRCMCAFGIGAWSENWVDLLGALPAKAVDKYHAVRVGDVFLSFDEEGTLIELIDGVVESLHASTESVTTQCLIEVAALICSFQFGMRAKQIALITIADVKAIPSGPHVHVHFRRVKQKNGAAFGMVRRVKQDWTPIFVELLARHNASGSAPTERFLSNDSVAEVAHLISNLTERVLPQRRGATDLRHSAAQRMVDAGATADELAEFLGHAHTDTSGVYFNHSPTQAERVNKALAISPIYQAITRIAHDRFISVDELSRLKEDQQIAGIPHGLPISGIGGCGIGQPSCRKNPIMSCYGCRKFMPSRDLAVHRQVESDLRNVVLQFVETSLGETRSPAYVQLARTIEEVQQVVRELEGEPS